MKDNNEEVKDFGAMSVEPNFSEESTMQKGIGAVGSTFSRLFGVVKTVVGGGLTFLEGIAVSPVAVLYAVGAGVRGFGGLIKNIIKPFVPEALKPYVMPFIAVPNAFGRIMQETLRPIVLHPIRTAEIAYDGVRMIKDGQIYNPDPTKQTEAMHKRYNDVVDKIGVGSKFSNFLDSPISFVYHAATQNIKNEPKGDIKQAPAQKEWVNPNPIKYDTIKSERHDAIRAAIMQGQQIATDVDRRAPKVEIIVPKQRDIPTQETLPSRR